MPFIRSFEATASATGAAFRAFGEPPQEEMAAAMASLVQLPLEEAKIRVAIGLAELESYVLDVTQSNVDARRRSYGLSGPNRLRETPVYTLFPAGVDDDRAPASRFRDPSWVRSTGGDPFVS